MQILGGVEELAGVLAQGPTDLVLLDVRWRLGGPPGRPQYDAGHLPGARFVDLEAELSGPVGRGGGRHPLPSPERFQHAMRTAGVRAGSEVVVYDGGDGMAAARCWWCLRYFGHRRVRVLDGGYRAWVAHGGPVSVESPPVPAGDFVARPGGAALLRADDAAELARSGVLLDARAAERYRGETEPVDPVAGHIPGAVNAPASQVVDGGGYRRPEQLRRWFGGLGATGDRPVGCYCGSGVSAAQLVLALAVAGVDAGLYVGSWSDWVSDPDRPVAT